MCVHCSNLVGIRHRTADELSPRSVWIRAKKVERNYSSQLRKVAKTVGDIVLGHDFESYEGQRETEDILRKYAGILDSWARATGARMVAEVDLGDRAAWMRRSRQMGAALRREIESAPTGAAMQEALNRQVVLIKSLPLEAAQRVHELTLEGIIGGTRADVVAKKIAETGQVTESRARLIARTETSRTVTALTQSRAEYVGSTAYYWRTSHDSDVRPSHAKMDGQVVRWDAPPTLDGMVGHAGQLPNCRCWPEPILPEEI